LGSQQKSPFLTLWLLATPVERSSSRYILQPTSGLRISGHDCQWPFRQGCAS
jgi:hypothetical protein